MREKEGVEREGGKRAEGGGSRLAAAPPGGRVFFAVDRGDGDDENDKLFKAAVVPVGRSK